MAKSIIITIAMLCLMAFACKNTNQIQDKQKKQKTGTLNLPVETSIDSFGNTDFVTTPETMIPKNMNIVYAPTLMMAWHEIEDNIGAITLLNNVTESLSQLNTSQSFREALNQGEYSVDSKINELGDIEALASFSLNLNFDPELQPNPEILQFKGTPVESFGMFFKDEGITNKAKIIYYKDDKYFIFRLKPKQKDHEIYFMKGLVVAKKLQDVLLALEKYTKMGESEARIAKKEWKYQFNENDRFAIPKFSFNIVKRFREIEGITVKVAGKAYLLKTILQRNGFLLNESGAKVESLVYIEGAAPSVEEGPEEVIQPKNMFLDDTFYIVIKHKERKNPYFIIKADNTELMLLLNK